jgi:hypothetical protein
MALTKDALVQSPPSRLGVIGEEMSIPIKGDLHVFMAGRSGI